MKYLFSFIALLWGTTTFCQIKTLEIEKEVVPVSEPVVGSYDGVVNFLPDKDFEQYVGQVFYMPKSTDEKSYRARRLYVKNPKNKKKEPLLSSKSLWEAMGKYYDVVGVEDIERFNQIDRYILLKDKEDGTIYYYWSIFRERGFPFIVVSYFERMKKEMIGDTIYFDGFEVKKFNVREEEFPTKASISILPFVCTDYVIDEQQKQWKEVLCMQNGDSLDIRLPLSWALSFHSTDAEVEKFARDSEERKRIIARNAEDDRRDKANIEMTFSEANKLIGTTIYNYNYAGTFWTAASIDAKEGTARVDFDINTPLKVIHVGEDVKDKFHAMLYFTSADGQLYMRSVCFHSRIDRDYFHDVFSKNDLRKQHKNISEKNWNQIKRGLAEIGMTMEECELAEGSPDSTSFMETAQGSTSVWKYYKRYLYFRNGRLVAIQD